YAMQLEPYFNHFSGDRVYTLTYEQMIHAPVETMRRLFGWLGLDASLAKETVVDQPENVTPEGVARARTLGLLQQLRQRRPFRALTPRVPAPVRRPAQRLTTRDMRRDRIDTSEVKRFLRPIQKTQTEQLSRLLGRNFPEWTTLYGDL